jgi:hypothetical protein
MNRKYLRKGKPFLEPSVGGLSQSPGEDTCEDNIFVSTTLKMRTTRFKILEFKTDNAIVINNNLL